jgi:two-component system phosphate regulon sensor histidine kinase PhoR
MRNYPIKKISIISIILFIGIVLMQAFWIYDSYLERKAHFNEHIYRILDLSAEKYCRMLENSASDSKQNHQQQLLDSIIRREISHLDKIPAYQCKIDTVGFKTSNEKSIEYSQKLDCGKDDHSKIYLLIENTGSYIIRGVIVWIILSILLIIAAISMAAKNLQIILKQKKLSQIQSDFIGNMTHELKTPIATISVASEMLMKDRVLDDREKSKRYSKIIYDENTRLKKLVERVMQIALFERGTMKIKLKEIDLHESIQKACAAINMIIKDKQGTLEVDLKATNTLYKVDPTHFSNIITNLLENGIKYSSGSPHIKVETNDYAEGISISISDKGIGIPKKYQERIFDRFFRVQQGDVHNTKGFGLGLYYVRRVVEAHGGIIKVRSEEDKGSTFELYFPKL